MLGHEVCSISILKSGVSRQCEKGRRRKGSPDTFLPLMEDGRSWMIGALLF